MPLQEERSKTSRMRGIFLVVIVFVLFLVVVWAFATTELYSLQGQFLYWNYFSHILMIVLGIGAIALARKSYQSYGFTLKNWRIDLSIAITCVISAAGYIPSLLFPSVAQNEPLNAMFIIVADLVALGVVLRQRMGGNKSGSPTAKLSLLALVPILSVATVAMDNGSQLIVSTVIFQFFFVGFGEEILFRGYMQSRLNEDFGRPWKFAGVNFGPSLLITSLLFGVLHMLNPFNPFTGEYALAIWWGITSTVTGILFGFVREKTGDVLAPSLAHGFVDLGQVISLLF